MPVLLNIGQSASKEEAVEEMKDCRSITQHWYIHMSIKSNKEIWLLLVEPLDLERVIHKSKRVVDTLQTAIGSVEIQASIETVHPASIDTVHLPSIDTVHPNTVHLPSIGTVHPVSIDSVHPNTVHSNTIHPNTVHSGTVHPNTVHPDTVHPDTVHPVENNTTCGETEKIEVLILKVDENEMLRDEEGRTRNSAGQLINAQDVVIPEMNDFDLSREWYDWVGQDPFQGIPHQDPRNHIEELEDLVSRSEQNEVSEYHMLCKIFPYSISWDAFRWFSQLQPGSLTSWDEIERAFLYKFLDDTEATREKEKNDKWEMFLASLDEEYMIPIQLLDDIMAKRDEQHVSGELSRVEEAEKEVTLEDFLELEEWLADMDQNSEKKLDDDQHTLRGDLETSPKASIDRQSADSIDLHLHSIIDRHPPDCIDRHSWLDELPGYVVEIEPIEERVHEVKRIHDPVKFVVLCVVFEADSPIPPDKVDKGPAEPVSIATDRIPSINTNKQASIDTTTSPSIDTTPSPSIDPTTSSSLDTGRISEQKEFDVCGNLRDGDITTRSDKSGGKKRRNWKKRKRIKDGPQVSLTPHFSDCVRKSRVRSRCFSHPIASSTPSCRDDRQRRRVYGGGFHTRMIKLQRIVLKILKWINLSTIHTCLDCLKEPKLTSNTKPDTTACLGAWYTWHQILQTSLEELHRRVRCLAMDGDLTTVRFSFELAFQCHRFGVNQHPVAEVMPVLMKNGQSASQEEAVEEMKDCRSITQH
ncbi:hypothetical protein DY000_02032835 [Brassica cretica]|uniref:Retrotransposon gag domain-containing protein n=1 Tax=Brassica cretica TaxID=69181 RepID=A0ABQ7DI68_BRACR|nr:hypothetical protein DY000_02032835 [Brassica cretica]